MVSKWAYFEIETYLISVFSTEEEVEQFIEVIMHLT
jgi:hypothetical protein